MRVRRALPILVPSLALSLLLGWSLLLREPKIEAERSAHQPLVSLREDVDRLEIACSEQQAKELATRTTEASLVLVEESELGPILRSLKQRAVEQGWEATFQTTNRSDEASPEGAQIVYLPAHGKLSTKAGNPQTFPRLLAFLDQLTVSPKRIDLTRLAIRADEQGRYFVELNFRLACRAVAHEKTP